MKIKVGQIFISIDRIEIIRITGISGEYIVFNMLGNKRLEDIDLPMMMDTFIEDYRPMGELERIGMGLLF